jgi:hypothetical protein
MILRLNGPDAAADRIRTHLARNTRTETPEHPENVTP